MPTNCSAASQLTQGLRSASVGAKRVPGTQHRHLNGVTEKVILIYADSQKTSVYIYKSRLVKTNENTV